MASSTLIADYIGYGLAADRPVTPPVTAPATAIYYETDTPGGFIWDGSAWQPIAGSASGTVTNVATGTGLSGGPITSTGTISLANTAVTPGSYTLSSLTVDAQGRLTFASSGSAVTSITAGTGLSGGTITSTGTISLPNSGVTAASYTNANITVDAQGRVTSAANGSAGGAAWSLLASNTISSPVANVDFTGLSANELMVLLRNVTASASGFRSLSLSTDNGGTYPSASGDYETLSTSGAESASTIIVFGTTAASTGVSGGVWIPQAGLNGVPKLCYQLNNSGNRLFVNSTSPVNALRITSITSTGNLTGGTIYVMGR